MIWGWSALIGLGLVFVAVGVVYRIGRWPPGEVRRARWYHGRRRDTRLPDDFRRNFAYFVPIGVALIVMTLAGPAVERSVTLALILFFAGPLIILIAPFLVPDTWLEPGWVREAEWRERAGEPPGIERPPGTKELTISYRMWWLQLIMILALPAVVIAALVFDFRAPISGGAVGVALYLLWALRKVRRPRQRRA